jgi:hypothetical protein
VAYRTVILIWCWLSFRRIVRKRETADQQVPSLEIDLALSRRARNRVIAFGVLTTSLHSRQAGFERRTPGNRNGVSLRAAAPSGKREADRNIRAVIEHERTIHLPPGFVINCSGFGPSSIWVSNTYQVQIDAAADFGRPVDFVREVNRWAADARAVESSPRGLLNRINDEQQIGVKGTSHLLALLTIAICLLFLANRTHAQANGLNVVVDIVALDRLDSLCHFRK